MNTRGALDEFARLNALYIDIRMPRLLFFPALVAMHGFSPALLFARTSTLAFVLATLFPCRFLSKYGIDR